MIQGHGLRVLLDIINPVRVADHLRAPRALERVLGQLRLRGRRLVLDAAGLRQPALQNLGLELVLVARLQVVREAVEADESCLPIKDVIRLIPDKP